MCDMCDANICVDIMCDANICVDIMNNTNICVDIMNNTKYLQKVSSNAFDFVVKQTWVMVAMNLGEFMRSCYYL